VPGVVLVSVLLPSYHGEPRFDVSRLLNRFDDSPLARFEMWQSTTLHVLSSKGQPFVHGRLLVKSALSPGSGHFILWQEEIVFV
jgi:hypothetical protein